MYRLFLISVLLLFQTISYANETNSNINQDDPYYQIGWKNLLNPIEKVIDIPGANASIGIIPDEIYLDEKDTIIKYEEYIYGSSSGDDAPILILTDREDFYTIKVEYNDSGYVDIERFKNTKNSEILNTLKIRGKDLIKSINWLQEPSLSEQKISNNGLRIDWLDGEITYQYTSIILGKEGYLTLTIIIAGTGEESNDFFEYYKSVINEVSSSVIFNDNYKYSDHSENNFKSLYTLSNIIDSSYGVGDSTDPTVTFVYCMPTTNNLKKAGIIEEDYSRFAGKEISLIISEVNKEISDVSKEDEISVLTGMYGPNDKQPFQKEGSTIIRYSNEIKVKDDDGELSVKYNYDNKIIFKDNKPKSFSAIIDQTGLSFNKWNLKMNCKADPYTEDEKNAALYVGDDKGNLSTEKIKELLEKIEKNKRIKSSN